MKEKLNTVERLKRILLQDKMKSYEGFFRVLRGDMAALLGCYLTFESEDLTIDMNIDQDGNYAFVVKVLASNIKSPNILD